MAESGVDDLPGYGVLVHRAFVNLTPRRKDAKGPAPDWLLPPVARMDDFGIQPNI
jgi:hypothetical protein